MAKKLTAEDERKAIEAEEKKLAQRRARLIELEQSERTELMTKSVLQKVPVADLKTFLEAVKKLGFSEANKRLKIAT